MTAKTSGNQTENGSDTMQYLLYTTVEIVSYILPAVILVLDDKQTYKEVSCPTDHFTGTQNVLYT